MTEPILPLAPGWIAASVAAIAIQIAAPPLIAWVVSKRLQVSWRYFWYGALIFLIFQLLTRVPLVQIAQVALGDTLTASPTMLWAWLALLSASAGVCEEAGRWIGYRWLFRPEQRAWRQGVMYGLGHGGLESMVLIGGLSALSLAGLLALNGADVVAQLPPEQREAARAQLAALAVQPAWFPLLGAWERLSALALHVGLSLIVLQAFDRRPPIWLVIAVVVHATVNFVAIALLRLLGSADPAVAGVAVELAIVLMAGAVVWASLRMYRGRWTI